MIAFLLALTFIFSIITIAEISFLTHNLFLGEYSTASIIFDAVGVGVGGALISLIPPFSPLFYPLFWIMVTGGVVKIVLVGFVIGSFMEMMTSFDVGTKLSLFRMHRLRGHIIICGYSGLAEGLIREINGRKEKFAVIEHELSRYGMLKDMGYNAIYGNFTEDMVLRDASILTAKAIVFAADNDYENLLGIVTARYLNEHLPIIARAKVEGSVSKMHRAGAGLCVVPEVLAGLEMGEAIASKINGE